MNIVKSFYDKTNKTLYHPGKRGGGNGDVIVNLKYQELLPNKGIKSF